MFDTSHSKEIEIIFSLQGPSEGPTANLPSTANNFSPLTVTMTSTDQITFSTQTEPLVLLCIGLMGGPLQDASALPSDSYLSSHKYMEESEDMIHQAACESGITTTSGSAPVHFPG